MALTTAVVRTIQSLGTDQPGRADQIADRLAEAIRLGLIAEGERLPAEATLSEQFGVSTLTLREALATLRERGLVVTRRGRAGGSFVAQPEDGAPSRSGLADLTVRQLREIGDLRQAIAGSAAALAAQRADAREVETLRRRVAAFAAASSADERRRADGDFGIEIASCAQSPRLTQNEANLRAEIGDLIYTLTSAAEHAAMVRARNALVKAIADRRPDRARKLAEQQIAHETRLVMQWRIDLYRAEPETEDAWLALADDIERSFRYLEETAAAFEDSYARVPDRYSLADIATLRPRIRETLDTLHRHAVGTGIVTAPGVVRDAPHWLEWWWREGDGAPEALRVNLDPDRPDFVDYVNDEWFDMPIRTRTAHITGPYVDYMCSNRHTFTLSVPAYHADRPIGVAAMDVPCDLVERRVMPALCALPSPTALLNADGRVIAANTAAAAPGTHLPDCPRAHGYAAATFSRLHALTGWRLADAVNQTTRA